MIDRVFAFQDVPCYCSIAGLDGGAAERVPVAKISKSKAIIETPRGFAKESVIPTRLEFPDGRKLVLSGCVVDSGINLLFLRWNHTEKDSAARLATMLVECASRKWPLPDGTGDGSVPTPNATGAPTGSASAHERSDFRSGSGSTSAGTGLRDSILKKSRTVNSADLAARHTSVQVLEMSTILVLIEEAVQESLAASERAWDAEERKKLLKETEQSFQQRLESLRAEKAGADSQLQDLRAQLGRARQMLDEERARVVSANQFTVSDAGIVELEQRMSRLFDHSLKAGGFDPEATREMREVVAKLLDDEREKIVAKAREAQSDAIALLEKKVGRLASTLENVSAERDTAQERARLLESAGGNSILKNLYKAGLADGDPNKSKKLELLKELVGFNKEVREHMAAHGTLAFGAAATTSGGASAGGETPAGGVKKMAIKAKSAAPPPLDRDAGAAPQKEEDAANSFS